MAFEGPGIPGIPGMPLDPGNPGNPLVEMDFSEESNQD